MSLQYSIKSVCPVGENTFLTMQGCLPKHIPVYFLSQEQMKRVYFILLFIINTQDLNFPTQFLEITMSKGINF